MRRFPHLNGLWIDEEGRIAIQCYFCPAIRSDMEFHLRTVHEGEPLAKKILEEIERMRPEPNES